jgi:hypothetical protein
VPETELFDEKQQLFDLMFQKLGDKCKEVLQLSFSLQFMEEVAKTECNLLCPQEEILVYRTVSVDSRNQSL